MNQHRMSGMLLVLAAVVGLLAACEDDDEVTGPPAPELLVASAGDQQAAVVGSTLSPFEVTLTGSDDRPLGGTTVSFTVVSRTGSVSPATATTDGSGKASTTLTLGTIAERVQVRATAGATSANFTATALADAPTSMTLVSGNNQDGGFSQVLAQVLSVELRDQHGNPVPGIVPSWTTPDGGDFVTAGSDAQGVARAAWILGPNTGSQTASASIGNQAANFAATSFDCVPLPQTVGSVNGTLQAGGPSCPLGDGRFGEFYTFTLAAAGGLSLDLSSAAFNPAITVEGPTGVVFALAPSTFIAGASLTQVILAGGVDYRVTATSQAPGETGAFSLTSAAASGDNAAGCVVGEVFVAQGFTSPQNLEATDCVFFVSSGGNPWYSDWYAVPLEVGDEVTIAMTSSAMDTFLTLFFPDFTCCAADDDDGGPGTSSLIEYTAEQSGVYTVDASTFNTLTTGAYTMAITIEKAASAPATLSALRLAAPKELPVSLRQIEKVKK